jgi:hypothetical protein
MGESQLENSSSRMASDYFVIPRDEALAWHFAVRNQPSNGRKGLLAKVAKGEQRAQRPFQLSVFPLRSLWLLRGLCEKSPATNNRKFVPDEIRPATGSNKGSRMRQPDEQAADEIPRSSG